MKILLRKELDKKINCNYNWNIEILNMNDNEISLFLKRYLPQFMESVIDDGIDNNKPDKYIDNLLKNKLGDFSKKYILIAYHNNEPIGILLALPYDENCMHIYSLGVILDYRKKGVGSELMITCINNMIDNKKKELIIDVDNNNTPAKKLYKKFGFI